MRRRWWPLVMVLVAGCSVESNAVVAPRRLPTTTTTTTPPTTTTTTTTTTTPPTTTTTTTTTTTPPTTTTTTTTTTTQPRPSPTSTTAPLAPGEVRVCSSGLRLKAPDGWLVIRAEELAKMPVEQWPRRLRDAIDSFGEPLTTRTVENFAKSDGTLMVGGETDDPVSAVLLTGTEKTDPDSVRADIESDSSVALLRTKRLTVAGRSAFYVEARRTAFGRTMEYAREFVEDGAGETMVAVVSLRGAVRHLESLNATMTTIAC